MDKNLKGKTAAIVAILVIFCYGIFGIPSGMSPAALKQALLNRISLGLDLKGGIHLELKVNVEDAIGLTTDHDVERLQDDLTKQGITNPPVSKLDPVGHPGTITVGAVPAANASSARSILEGVDYNNYDVTSNTGGGWTLTMKPGSIRDLEQHTLDTSIETIRQRVDSLGVAEPLVAPFGMGDNEIVVEIPGVSDPARVEDLIGSTARLEIHAVVGQSGYENDQAALQAIGGTLPPDQELVRGSGQEGAAVETWVLERAPVVEGLDFRDAQTSTDQNGRPDIHFTLTTEAGDRFFKYTSAHSRDSATPGSMAIVLDNQVREVATINSAIRDSGEIEGGFTRQQADDLSLMLRTGSLPASITYLETRSVGATLGTASVRQGVFAAVAGMLAVMIFMLIYYRGAGINADIALILNLVILLGFLGFLGHSATLTLPGIAGVILTIGMGVDSNVLIFERIREELRTGKTPAAAIQKGFSMTGALVTIVDTHVTTIVSAGILFIFGTGPVQGFAVTLTFGLLANLFTSVFVSRVIFDAVLAKKERGAELSI